jgi:UDP-N-acetylmuramoyl-L-alanyl-D-glutamate--2,6-diaminopimelate ligase
VTVRRDRAEAIGLVVDQAGPGDVVVVAGKGHEREIEIGSQRLPFDDREEAVAAVARHYGPAGTRRGDDR